MKAEIFNTTKTKQLNIELVRNTLIKRSACTRKRIADETGLSIATCGNILNELIEHNEVFESDSEESNGGRPAKCYDFNPNYSFVAGISISNEKEKFCVNYAVANMAGEVVFEDTETFKEIKISSIEKIIDGLTGSNGLIKAIGIGVPGVVSDGIVVDDCDIKDLIGYPLAKTLTGKYSIKIIVENDMNLKALGFYREQQYGGPNNVAVINFPANDCSGSGIIIDGHLLKGNSNFAGEVSYLPLGIAREKLLEQAKNADEYLPYIINTLVSVIAITNPGKITLTGELVKPDMLDEIVRGCRLLLPAKHIPEIIIKEDISDEYLKGLIYVTLKSLSCEVQLIKKRI